MLAAILAALALSPTLAMAQHRHAVPQRRDSTARADSMLMDTTTMMHGMMEGPLGVSMTREGSGTSWLPDVSPMYAIPATAGPWLFMLQGNAFLQYLDEGSERGDEQLGSINWAMGMAHGPLAGGNLTARLMMSAEAATVGKCGYPDLQATGEFCHGQRLHDRQHPHDLFMEIAASYEHAITDGLAFQLYGGPVGEPALGPTAYPHRPSALPNAIAPMSHHWLDATHISFGVATAGLYGRRWKLEGSIFNGREPDEDRYDIDLDHLDSYSGRIWFLPSERWALQASVGRLVDVEPAHDGEPAESLTRPTASVTYHRQFGPESIWASTIAWGSNIEKTTTTNAVLAETNLTLGERDVVFARAEVTQKTGKDLALEDVPGLEERKFTLGKLALGYTRQFGPIASLLPGIGGGLSLDLIPAGIRQFYGERVAAGVAVYISLHPAPMAVHTAMQPMVTTHPMGHR